MTDKPPQETTIYTSNQNLTSMTQSTSKSTITQTQSKSFHLIVIGQSHNQHDTPTTSKIQSLYKLNAIKIIPYSRVMVIVFWVMFLFMILLMSQSMVFQNFIIEMGVQGLSKS
eukprot:485674_1